jgi:hypothetical protein
MSPEFLTEKVKLLTLSPALNASGLECKTTIEKLVHKVRLANPPATIQRNKFRLRRF